MAAYPAIFDASQTELKEQLRSLLELDKKSEARNLLYSHYSLSLRNAVSGVFLSPNFDDPTFDLYQQLLANVSRFSAFKAQHVLDELLDIPPDKDPALHISDVINKFNRYQAAEYNAATARARSAKQWADWDNDPILSELYPNIRWLPSRSANPRPEHQAFYGLVLPRNDPFWDHNQPGNLWNCKCDWEPTDSNISRASISKADLNKARRHSSADQGLDGNPAKQGKIFTDGAAYFRNAHKNTKKNAIYSESIQLKRLSAVKTSSTNLGTVSIGKWHWEEAAKSNTNSDLYFLKNEVAKNIDIYLPHFDYEGPEDIDLTHNSTTSKSFKIKRHARLMHIYTKVIFGRIFVCKVLEMKDGALKAWTTYIK